MKKTASIVMGALATLLIGSGSASAARWVDAAQPTPKGRDLLDTATRFTAAHRAELSLEGVDLVPRNALTLRGKRGTTATLRFEQRHAGLRVHGAGVAVRVDAAGHAQSAMSQTFEGLSVDPTPAVDLAAATDIGSAAAPGAFALGKSELAVLPDRAEGRLVWILDFPDARGGMRVFVDAHDGAVVRTQALALDVMGRVYTENSVDTPVPVDVELLDLDVAAPQHLDGWGGLLAVTNYVSGDSMSMYTVEQTLGPNVGADFLYDPPAMVSDTSDGFAQVNLYHHLTDIRRFFAALGVDMTGPDWKLTAVANATEDGAPMNNAFYSPAGIAGPFAAPNLISIGQGSVNDFAYDSDVFKHEFGHYVTGVAVGYNMGITHTTTYGFSPFSSSIDEGIADYFACSDNGDPTLGEASLALLGGARDLTDTTKKCPDDMFGESHADGEIIGSLGWSIRTLVGADAADKLMWGAVSLMPQGGTFGDLAQGITDTAASLVTSGDLTAADVTAIQAEVDARGISDCNAEMAIEGTGSRKLNMIGLDVLAQLFGASCGALQGVGVEMPGMFHFYRETAATDVGVRFKLDIAAMGAGAAGLRVVVRKGEHATFGGGGMIPLPTPQTFDSEVTFDGVANGEIVIDASSTPAFEPGARYYVAFTNPSCPFVNATVTAENIPGETMTASVTSASTGGDTTAVGSGGGGAVTNTDVPGEIDIIGGGCDCATAAGDRDAGRLGLIAAAVAVVAVARRRRRSAM